MNQNFVEGVLPSPIGDIPRVSSTLTRSDRWGSLKARWSIGRMNYRIDPGLYALGSPDDRSPVFVTANYKMSFDRLREALPDVDTWILVLDTNGINVWCAAGKGTFGTDELVSRVACSGLARVVSHRDLILPQLSAPGVAAHEVKKRSGFRVSYGPIRATDLPAFMAAGRKATPSMRHKTFTTKERAVLIPVELVGAFKWALLIMAVFFFLGGLGGPGRYWANVWDFGGFAVLILAGALFSGAVLTPLLLPWIPGRAFSLKGVWCGLIVTLIMIGIRGINVHTPAGALENLGWLLLAPALASYLAMNFTGASSYTSLSGVRKEMRWGVPFQIAGGALGFGLWLGSRFMS